MMYIIGVFLFLLGILLDDGTTLLLFLRGHGALETNPLYVKFGYPVMVAIIASCYVFIVFAWGRVIKTYRKVYNQRIKGYKLFDLFVFFCCFMLIFISSNKIEIGYNNVELLVTTFQPEDNVERIMLEEATKTAETIKLEDPVKYKEMAKLNYVTDTIDGVSYLQMIFYVICSYLLFRVGHKVCPWDMA